jgi:hypothetical protein
MMGGVGWALYLLGEGSMYIPRLTILGAEVPAAQFIAVFYGIIVLAFLVSALMLWRIAASPFGQALRASATTRCGRPPSGFRSGNIAGARSSFPEPSLASPAVSMAS